MSEQSKYLIVGLGNPGRHFRGNRHNAGYMLIDRMLERYAASMQRSVGEALVAIIADRVVLAKPQTYVNESGRSVASLIRTFGINISRLLIVFDDLDLPLGTLRMRPFGGSSGQRGMRSVTNHLGTQEFPRLRIGIGRPQGQRAAEDYVLSDFSDDQQALLDSALDRGAECVRRFIAADIQIAMTECNTSEQG